MSGPRGAWLRAAPAVVLGVGIACVVLLAFVPSVVALYESRGSPPVSVDARWLSLGALIANVGLLVLFALALTRRGSR